MVIRAISDPAFAREIRDRDAEEARRVGRRLRALRERRGLSQKDVAKSLGMKAPQLAKIESGEQDLRLSTLRSVLRVLGASFEDIVGPDAQELSLTDLAKAVNAPEGLLRAVAQKVEPRDVAAQIARGFKWELAEVLTGAPKSPSLGIQMAFKATRESERRQSPVERLARTISEISAATAEIAKVDLPADAATLREAVLAGGEREITLGDLTSWAWEHGIVVAPMGAGPGFEAVAWYVGKRPVVVLRLKRDFAAQWLFTLAHEIGHLALGHVSGSSGVIDITEPGKVVNDTQEDEANEFAKDLLAPNSDELFAEIRSRMPTSRAEQKKAFKGTMVSVAKAANLDPALFGFLAAFAMRDIAEDNDRWGSATNLAKGTAGRSLICEAYLHQIDLNRLDTYDAALVRAVVLE